MKLSHLFPLSFLFRGVQVVDAAQPKHAAPDTPWEELREELSSPSILNLPAASEWEEQCLRPMLKSDTLTENFHLYGYDIGYKPAGVCMIHMLCMYENCNSPPSYFQHNETAEDWRYNQALEPPFDSSDLFEDIMELPAAVLHPKVASDIVHGIEFAQKHDISISVKVLGHSYFGASTNRGTLLIKMSSHYPQYGIEGSLTECSGVDTTNAADANGVACALATARGKDAFIRVGGGEVFDTAYRAVFSDWNKNPDNINKYYFVGGYCGTVSVAGGWMQSGGLSGSSMRLHGIGIDQVLHIEMVLPNGNHVRFGPSSWEGREVGFAYPKTTVVTGYCNTNSHETDESLWKWATCEEENNFEDLWFAVRGGGGGTFGIVTSVYYQLHEPPGKIQRVLKTTFEHHDILKGKKIQLRLDEEYLRFMLRYLFLPETLHNVTEIESRSCNSPSMKISSGYNSFFCHNSAGDKFIDEWKKYLETSQIKEEYGNDEDIMTVIQNLFIIHEEYDSQIDIDFLKDGPYAGHLEDDGGVMFHGKLKSLSFDHVPMDTVKNYLDELIAIMLEEFNNEDFQIYLMGGAVPFSSDQMDALGPLRRNAAFSKLANPKLFTKYYELFFRDVEMDNNFPGIFCHNHASNAAIGPLKTDWTQACPTLAEASQVEREQMCVSQAESFWGTTNVAHLERIKRDIDPNNLFICNAGIGSSTSFKMGKQPKVPKASNVSKGYKSPKQLKKPKGHKQPK